MSAQPVTFKRFDVRRLLRDGVEPFPEIRKRIDALAPGEGLAVLTPFLPSPLIELLRSESFSTRAESLGNGSWVTYFWRENAA